MITVYSPSLDRLGTITQYTSAQWTKKFYDTGSFEIHIPNTAEGLIHLEIYNIIHANDNWGYILKRQWNEKEVVIYGYDLCGLLEYRGTQTSTAMGDNRYTIEELLSHATDKTIIVPTGISLKTYNYYDDTASERSAIKIDIIANLIREATVQEEIGYDIYITSSGEMQSEIKRGADRTYLVFSADRNDIIDFNYEDDYYKNANVCVYLRDTDTANDYIARDAYNPQGLSVSSTKRQEMIYNESIRPYEERGEDLNSGDEVPKYMYKNINISKAITFTPSQYIYKKDYFLGDYVTVKVDVFGKTLCETKQITEVAEVFESAKREVKLTLGTAKKNYIRVLKNKGVI